MKQYIAPLLLAAAMIAIALLAVFDIIPEKFAQFSPLLLLAFFPSVWLRNGRNCNAVKGEAA